MESKPKTYFIATRHAEYAQRRFPEGSTVIDPWRYIPDQKGVDVIRVGENKPVLISLLLPTRDRSIQFGRMEISAYRTATHPRSIEIIAYMDEDDPGYLGYGPHDQNTRIIRGPRILLSECWNRCYEESKGEILMHCGDDIEFQTPGWDAIVRSEFEKSEDKLLFVYGDDLGPNGKTFGTHGFVHRRWVEALGYFVPPLFSSDWNDVWLNEVAEKIGRHIRIPIITEHHHYVFEKAERDNTYREREERGERDQVVELFKKTQKERDHDVAKLKALMS